MMSQPTTILLILTERLARVDLTGGRKTKVKQIWTRDRLPGASTAVHVDAALRLGPKNCRNVLVLATDFWSGIVDVPPDVAGMLEGDELEQAVALETESYSGIPAFESKVGLRKIGVDATGDHRWWVTQVPNTDWQEIQRNVKLFSGKLIGIAHPALAEPPADAARGDNRNSEASWRMVQAFGETTIALAGTGENITSAISMGSLETQRTRSQLDEWTATQEPPASNYWISDGEFYSELTSPSDHKISLSASESALSAWATSAARAVTAAARKSTSVPLPTIVPPKPPVSNNRAMLIAASIGAVVALACGGLYTITGKQLAALQAEVEVLDAQKKRLGEERKTLQTLEKSLTTQRKTLDELLARNTKRQSTLDQATQMRTFQQTRWLKMIDSLAQATGDDCWIREITSDDRSVTIKGIAASNHEVSRFASKLEDNVSPHGWEVHPAQTEVHPLALIEFNIKLDITDAATIPMTSTTPFNNTAGPEAILEPKPASRVAKR